MYSDHVRWKRHHSQLCFFTDESKFCLDFHDHQTKPPGMQCSILGACPKPGLTGGVARRRASSIQMVGMMQVGAPIVQMGWRSAGFRCVSASVIFPLHHKTQKMACVTT